MCMDAMWRIRIYLIISILLLGIVGVNKPIYEKSDLVNLEGKDISLAFVKIVNIENNRYTVKADFTNESVVIVSNGTFSVGDTVSFYGTIKQGILYASKYHIHLFPKASYVLSIPGLLLFLFLLSREWKIERFMFVRRN